MTDYSAPLYVPPRWHTADLHAEMAAAAKEAYERDHPEPTYYREEPIGWLSNT